MSGPPVHGRGQMSGLSSSSVLSARSLLDPSGLWTSKLEPRSDGRPHWVGVSEEPKKTLYVPGEVGCNLLLRKVSVHFRATCHRLVGTVPEGTGRLVYLSPGLTSMNPFSYL